MINTTQTPQDHSSQSIKCNHFNYKIMTHYRLDFTCHTSPSCELTQLSNK